MVVVIQPEWTRLPRETRWNLTAGSPAEQTAAARAALVAGSYQLVVLRDVESPNDAFRILNQDSRPTGRAMRSMSVGDLVLLSNGSAFLCSAVGWSKADELAPELAALWRP